MLICKRSLTSSLCIYSCWVYLILRSLTALLYVLHMCRGSFTSPFIHYILCFMWLGFSNLFSYKCMYARGVNFTSLLVMNLYRVYIYFIFFTPLLMKWQKERNLEFIYACYLCFNAYMIWYLVCFIKRREFICIFILFFMHICLCLKLYWISLYVYVYT